ncbi:MAG TPA: cystathionine gamma-synthase [Dehalococcoidia bacterium]|nr:cystathionine gamma-synthase [Dehalococcoidia bacterium]
MNEAEKGFSTRAIHAGQPPDPTTGAIMTPVYMSSTFVQERPTVHKGYEYSRSGNPTRTALEACIASLENGRYGLAFASGLAAEDAIVKLLRSGDHVVAGDDLYGGTFRLIRQVYEQFGIGLTSVDTSDLAALRDAMRPNTRMVWLESPSNPLLKITDIQAAAANAHEHDSLVVVDNTFATPYLQRPLDLGADIVVHSTTKYMGGHSDVVGGAIVVNDDELAERLAFLQNAAGGVPGPMDCFLVLRGLKTLAVRMDRHCDNAEKIAMHLSRQQHIKQVFYPGLESHAGADTVARQMARPGGMISFVLDGSVEEAKRLTSMTKVFSLAESLGGVESLIEHPPTMTHASISREQRLAAGLDDGLIRLSVGIEDVEDLIADLDQAIARCRTAAAATGVVR